MNTGKKIKLIRTFRGLTQKELGDLAGIHEVAIRKYELGKNLPKPEQLRKIADALNVNVNTLAEFDIQTDGDILPLLFAIDEVFPATIKEVDGTPGIFFENKSLVQFLKDWQAMKELLQSGSQTQDNYEIWKTIRPSVTKVTHDEDQHEFPLISLLKLSERNGANEVTQRIRKRCETFRQKKKSLSGTKDQRLALQQEDV